MSLQKSKTVLLIILIVGVILQTGKLWFEEASGHNFFSSFTNVRAQAQENYSMEPETAMVNLGNAKYIKLGENAGRSIRQIADSHILQLVKDAKFVETRPLSLSVLLDQKSVIYEYPLTISTEAFARSLGVSGGEFTSKARQFDTIIIRPARTSSESVRFFVMDQTEGTVQTFDGARGISEPLGREIDMLGREVSARPDITYISSIQNSLDFFTGNVFLPEWQTSSYAYSKAFVSNPVDDAQNLEKCVQFFFDNPVGVLSAVDPAGVPFVSDKETVVKYYGGAGVLEYTNYKTQKQSRGTLDMAYTAARNFMKRDQTLVNSVYMTGGEYENGLWRLFFDYSWNGARVFLGENSHAIEITVSGEAVVKYRRVVKRIEASELPGEINESFISVIDRVLLDEDNRKTDDMALGHDASANGFCDMAWFVEIDGSWEKK